MNTLTAQELKKKMEETSGLLVVNVLPADSFNDCHITSSINIPLEELEEHAKEWPKHKKIVVYCAHDQCPLSHRAYELLTKLGFQNVFAYEGGIKEWHKKGLPTKGECKADFLK
jgi:rhodanese-related sulfurtransferase